MEKMKRSICASARDKTLALLLLSLGFAGGLCAQQSLESNYRLAGPGVLAAFEPQRQVMQKSSAVIYSGRRVIAYGVVMTGDGYILSKASEVDAISDLSVRVDREEFKSAKVVLVDQTWDVALVKVDASGLVPVRFAPSSDLEQGTWVVVNGATSRTSRRVLAGVISAKQREITPEGGAVLGVQLEQDDERLLVKEVSDGSGAQEAGIQPGDLITAVEGKPVKEVEELTGELKDKRAGSKVKISVERAGEKLELDVRLAARGELFAEVSRNDAMSGNISRRRSGFPKILQHDVLANSNTMGGPVLALDGRMIGMNIARANRAETFAIPVEELRPLAEGMIKQARQ
jgi:serine protease Do